MKPYHRYINEDPRCNYPHDPSNAGYCWSYAEHVDGNLPNLIERACRFCELFSANRTRQELNNQYREEP